ncbi:MAG: hypothetical protein ACKOB1_08005 [Planctomycetia bacterium]
MATLTTRLFIVRHAWAEDPGPGIDDHARRQRSSAGIPAAAIALAASARQRLASTG